MSQIRAAILTISDTASKDRSADKSGPTICAILQGRGLVIKYHDIVPDDDEEIRRVVSLWIESGNVDWIVTTGGTGFGVRDRTPEAISPLIERHAPGLVHLMLSASLQHTPLAALSRPIAGTIRSTLVVTLPGSVKAVRENLDALLGGGVLDHAVELIKGGSGQATHSTLASVSGRGNGGHHHFHDHGHHGHSHKEPQPRSILSTDPALLATTRHRISPYPLVSFGDALLSIMANVLPLNAERKPVTPDLKGHVLAEDVFAPQNVPLSQTTNVDGYALRSSDEPGTYRVVTPATHPVNSVVPEGSVYRINTGAPLPAGTDSVIMVEDTELVTTHADGLSDAEELEVKTLVSVPIGDNVRAPGSDVRAGDLVLSKGDLLRSSGGEIGTLVFVGRKEVEVYRKPVVAILSTGNELLDLHEPIPQQGEGQWGGIWDTNRPSLQAALEGLGYEVMDLGIVSDQLDAHVEAIRQGLDRADILLTTGGTSMGTSDLLKPVIERRFDGTIHFGRVKIKPGKPTTFATIPVGSGLRKPLFALPGNPASALVTFHVFVVPALRRMEGRQVVDCQFPRVKVKLCDAMKLDPRVEFHRVLIRADAEGLRAFSTGGQRSSRVASLSGANGLVILPEKTEQGRDLFEVGDEVDAMVIGELESR
ncbi:hypothetical protein BV25DRAFT_1904010 [Artomyces pyxidatus]|uniref:Uncharacterized protein n=1 Tax=Artomyces pyxidatus TaxID=48021 RepID=A0ACB8TJN3_9AGAM|nr:hypothetical protein BV25DRAFT_1904010 [Artomyces pyxidatus]